MLRYRELLGEILARAYADSQSTHALTFKNSFGAVAGYVDGKTFCTYGKFGFALKLPKDVVERLITVGEGQALRYFPNGRIKREYVVLKPGLLEDEPRLRVQITTSVEFVAGQTAGRVP